MDRCISEMTSDDENLDESDAEEACQIAWDEKRSAAGVVHKTHAGEVKGMTFVLSDRASIAWATSSWPMAGSSRISSATPSRSASTAMISSSVRWKDVRIEDSELRGRLELAPEGTSPRIDEIRRLVDAGILRAVSVGFRPLKHEPLDRGRTVERRALSGTGIGRVLACERAGQRQRDCSREVTANFPRNDGCRLRQARQKRRDPAARVHWQARQYPTRTERGSVMSTLNQRISDVQVAIAAKTAALEELIAKMDDSDVSDAEYEANTKLRADLAKLEKTREMLIESEKHLARKNRKRERQHHHQWRRLAQSRIEHDRAAASRGERPRCADHPSQWPQKGLRAARSARARWHRCHPREGVGRLDGSRADENLRRRCRRPRKHARSSCAPLLRQR